jgi:hypothetical protein
MVHNQGNILIQEIKPRINTDFHGIALNISVFFCEILWLIPPEYEINFAQILIKRRESLTES